MGNTFASVVACVVSLWAVPGTNRLRDYAYAAHLPQWVSAPISPDEALG